MKQFRYQLKKANQEYSTQEIANALGITENEVREAEKSALRKLSVWLCGIDD